jgi:hypothetical protein
MNEYNVGQILYLMSEKTTKIMPIQVVEEVVRTTLEGKEKTYTVQLPDQKKTKLDIGDLKGEIFDSTNVLRVFMIDNATRAIDRMLDNSKKLRDAAFEYTAPSAQLEDVITESIQENISHQDMPTLPFNNLQPVQQSVDDDIIKIDLGDGKVATMKAENFKALEK